MAAASVGPLKVCSKCGEAKTLDNFATQRVIDGAREPRAHCRPCYNAVRRAHYSRPAVKAKKNEIRREYQSRPGVLERRHTMRAMPEIKEKERAAVRAYRARPEIREQQIEAGRKARATLSGRAAIILTSCCARARKKGMDVDLTREWVAERISQNRCEVTGIPFEFGRPPRGWRYHPYSPSVDRIDSAKGYTKDNCRVVVTALNLALGQWGEEIFERVAVSYLRGSGFRVARAQEIKNEQSLFDLGGALRRR